MRKLHAKRTIILYLTVIIISVFLFAIAAYADEITVTVGTPDDDGGEVYWQVTRSSGTKVDIKIKVPANYTDKGKADLLEQELKKNLFTVKRNGAEVTIGGVQKVEKFQDATHEQDKIAGKAPKKVTMDFHLSDGTALAGIDQNGSESKFYSSLGFDGILVDANLNFSDLSGNTIDALLTDTYNSLLADLPIDYKSGLSLDLSSDVIAFLFPTGTSEGFVETFTSDVNTFSTSSLETVPEPTTMLLLCLGFVGLAGARRRFSN